MQIRLVLTACLLSCACCFAQDAPAESRPSSNPFAAPDKEFKFAERFLLPTQPKQPAPGARRPERHPVPNHYASRNKEFKFAVPLQPVKPPQKGSASAEVCSIPLVNVTPKVAQTRMPVIPAPSGQESEYAMKFAQPPAPACADWNARTPQAPETKP